ETQPLHQRDVRGEAVILVACDIAVVPVVNETRRAREALPDAGPGTVRERRAFDLVRRRRRAPEEGFGEFDVAIAFVHLTSPGDPFGSSNTTRACSSPMRTSSPRTAIGLPSIVALSGRDHGPASTKPPGGTLPLAVSVSSAMRSLMRTSEYDSVPYGVRSPRIAMPARSSQEPGIPAASTTAPSSRS